MTDQHQTEAQRLAALLRSRNNNQVGFGLGPVCDEAALELLRLNAVHTDLERVEMQLAACGVVAMADTPDSAKKARIMHPDYESASCDDVKRRVDECIALRARVAELEDVLTNLPLSSPQRMRARIQRLEEMLAAVGAGGVGPLIPATVQHQREPSSDNDLPIENGQLITSCNTVPAGWKPVPLELTQAMLDQLRFGWSDISTAHVFDRWKRTVAAAPQPPVVGHPQQPFTNADATPKFSRVAERKLDSLLADGWAISGYSICKLLPSSEMRHGFVTSGGLVGWWQEPHPTQAKQPPTTEQSSMVEQPQGEQEPVAVIGDVWTLNWVGGDPIATIVKKHGLKIGTKLYTHPQNLRCKSNQARLATLWGYVKEQPQQEQEWKRRLGNLLAVIHGDGGHYIDAHGWDKAQADAEEKAARIMTGLPQSASAVWPRNASEVRAFLSGHVAAERYARDDHQPDDSDTYTLSAHDLLEAIDWWTDFDQRPSRPLPEVEVVALYQSAKLHLDERPAVFDFVDGFRAAERVYGIGGEA